MRVDEATQTIAAENEICADGSADCRGHRVHTDTRVTQPANVKKPHCTL